MNEILSLTGITLESSKLLHNTIKSFQASKKSVRELKKELETLIHVLESLKDTIQNDDQHFKSLKLPLSRCDNACKDFNDVIVKCTPRLNEDRKSFRDWVKLQYLGDDIESFKGMIASYKSTIIVALGDANIRHSVVTINVLKEYKDLIENTKSDLTERLELIEYRLKNLPQHNKDSNILSEEDLNRRNHIKEEINITLYCLNICTQVSKHIDQIRPSVFVNSTDGSKSSKNDALITSLEGLISPRDTTEKALSQCITTIDDASSQLNTRLHLLDNHLDDTKAGSQSTNIPQDEEQINRQKIQDEYKSTQKSLAICSEASDRFSDARINYFENITIDDDSNQIIVSTIGDLISAKGVNAGSRSSQWLGQMSDQSLQEVTRNIGQLSVLRPSSQESKFENDFQARHGPGSKIKNTIAAVNTMDPKGRKTF